MKLTRLIALLALVGVAAIACSDDDPTAPIPGIGVFVGDWEATVADVESESNPDSTLDILLGGLATVTLSVAMDSTYEFTHDLLAVVITGDFLITGANTFSLTNDANTDPPLTGTFALANTNTELSVVLPGTEIHPDPTSIYNPGELTASFDKQ